MTSYQSKIDPRKPILPSYTVHLPTEDVKSVLEVDARALAKLLSFIEFELFSRVSVYECLDQIWGDKRRKELSKIEGGRYSLGIETGIAKMIKHTNKVSFLI